MRVYITKKCKQASKLVPWKVKKNIFKFRGVERKILHKQADCVIYHTNNEYNTCKHVQLVSFK